MKKIASQGNKHTRAEASAYVSSVKRRFARNSRNYDQFLQVMKDYKHQGISLPRVVKRMKKIMRGHNDLLLGFITFFPKGFEITVPPPTFEDAFRFLAKVKARDGNLEQSFLDIMKDILEEKTPFTHLSQKAADVFHKHPDLLYEFTQFLPDSANQPEETTSGVADEHSCILSCVACLAQMVQNYLKL